MPVARTEVAGAAWHGGIAVVGGFRAGCVNSRTVAFYSVRTNRWRTLAPLPIALNHATAASHGGGLYVAGGYYARRRPSTAVFVFDGARWRRLRPLPTARAAAASVVLRGRWYVLGGVAPGGLARRMLVYDFGSGRWSSAPGPSPRQHLAAATAAGTIFAAGGRSGGADSNLSTFERYDPPTGRWTRLVPVPEARGGTGLAAVGRLLVSVGGETTARTLGEVYGYDVDAAAWRSLAPLPTPRHGLAVVAVGRRVYAVAGGTEPGCSVSRANELLTLGR